MVDSYVPNEVVVFPGPRHARAVKLLKRAAGALGAELVETEHSRELADVLHDPEYQRVPQSFELRDRPRDRLQRGPADAPLLIEEYEAQTSHDDGLKVMVGLNRELQADASSATSVQLTGFGPISIGHSPVGQGPITIGHGPISIGHGPISIGHGPITIGHNPTDAYGDRQPVAWAAPEPRRSEVAEGRRRPVVMTLDTGIGDHPWFQHGVTTGLELDGVELGYTDPATDPERRGQSGLAGGLDSHSGHGTFIAGLIRQICPDAHLHAVRLMRSNGVANEYELLRVLHVLVEKIRRAKDGRPGGLTVDVLVMSFGYAHDLPADVRYDDYLLPVLEELGSLGVAVVAAAGNNASTQKVYPAAFAPHDGGRVSAAKPGIVPVTSVGSLNPNGTVALFSNAGKWVSAWLSGAALVSTMPTGLNGGLTPSVSVVDRLGMRRSSIDPDDFSGGFGVWSGTSFAAPLFAGHLAQALWETGRLGDAGFGPEDVMGLLGEVVAEHSNETDDTPPRG